MNTPRQPADHPTEPDANDHPTQVDPSGVPEGAEDHEPKGSPNSNRHQTETVPKKT